MTPNDLPPGDVHEVGDDDPDREAAAALERRDDARERAWTVDVHVTAPLAVLRQADAESASVQPSGHEEVRGDADRLRLVLQQVRVAAGRRAGNRPALTRTT